MAAERLPFLYTKFVNFEAQKNKPQGGAFPNGLEYSQKHE